MTGCFPAYRGRASGIRALAARRARIWWLIAESIPRQTHRAGRFAPLGPHPYADLLRGNLIAMHAAVLYRTEVLRLPGGFHPSLRRCEDYDHFIRLARDHPIACHSSFQSPNIAGMMGTCRIGSQRCLIRCSGSRRVIAVRPNP